MSETFELKVRLILGAKHTGRLDIQAAAMFLTKCEDVIYPGHPWLIVEGDMAWVDWDKVLVEPTGMSGGTVATWQVAKSMVRGDLGEAWRLDQPRREALVRALNIYLLGREDS